MNLLSYRDVMQKLSCSESAVRTLAKNGAITRKFYPGIGYRYDEKSVEQYIKTAGIKS